jgi:hypothetical protein
MHDKIIFYVVDAKLKPAPLVGHKLRITAGHAYYSTLLASAANAKRLAAQVSECDLPEIVSADCS